MGSVANRAHWLLAACLLLPGTTLARDAEPLTWALCPPLITPQRSFAAPSDLNALSTYVTAEHIESRDRRYYFLDGDAKILQEDQWIEASSATYDQDSGEVTADGSVVFGETDFSITGSSLRFNAERYQGRVDQAAYFLPAAHAQGKASSVRFDNENLIHLDSAYYTTCIGEEPDWTLGAPRVTLDRQSGFGTARNVVLRFYDVPVFYFPYISFPITSDRKSGFLYPNVAYSDDDGFEIAAPYYINLAPNYDLTLIPRSIWRRGLMIEGEGRYLTPSSNGMINFGYLGNDERFGQDRKSAALTHHGNLAPNLTLDAKANYVSDGEYLHDFGNSINNSTTDHLDRIATLRHVMGRTSSQLVVRSFQTVDPDIPVESYPYRQLPKLLVSSSEGFADDLFEVRARGELVRFQHPVLVSARRIDLTPEIRMRWRRPGGFFTPGLAVRHTQYDISDNSPSATETISRTVPIATLDTGLFFERDVKFEGTAFLQTLEPRLFYARIPYKKQSDIPIFDTAVTTFSFGQMFRPNRFSGADRVGDADQLTAALTTRLYDNETGFERFNFSAGQVFYFEDREVTLRGSAVATQPRSSIAAQSNLRLTRHVRVRADSIYDPFTEHFSRSGVRMQYKDTKYRLVNVAYRLNHGSTEQTDYSVVWPLSTRWWFAARWLRDYNAGRSLEIMEGLQYSSCCWNARLMSHRHYDAAVDKVDNRLMLEWELKGLASVGKSVLSVLDESIAGFADPLE